MVLDICITRYYILHICKRHSEHFQGSGMKLCSRLLMLLKKARKPISKKKQVSIIYQSEKGPQEQIGKQRWGSAAALLQDGERDQRPSQPLHLDGRRFPERTCKCCAVFLEHLGVLQDREAASVRWEKVTVCTCFNSVCKRESAIASNVVTVESVCVNPCSRRNGRGSQHEAISQVYLQRHHCESTDPSSCFHQEQKPDSPSCKDSICSPLHGPGEANTQRSQPWPHHPVTLFYSA